MAAIHISPEAVDDGMLAKVKTGDVILMDWAHGVLQCMVSEQELAQREAAKPDLSHYYYGMGRELFGSLRQQLSGAEQGACSLFTLEKSLYE